MRLQTDPSSFSITAFLADQVTLVGRQEKLPPGAALLKIQELSRNAEGRARLLRIIGDAEDHEHNGEEAVKIAAIRRELVAWGYDEEPAVSRRDDVFGDLRDHRAAA